MSTFKNKVKDDNAPKSFRGWLAILLPCLATLSGVIYTGHVNLEIQQRKENHDINMYKMKNTNIQYFYSETESVERLGMEFVKYKIQSEPAVKGFHVIVYPYVVYGSEEKRIIPIEGQFMQEEYVADGEGCCILFRENTTDDLTQTVEAMMDFSVDVKCLVAVKYVENNEERIEVFDLKDGQLTESKTDTVIKVLEAWQEKDKVNIDMKGWPDYNQSNLKEILS